MNENHSNPASARKFSRILREGLVVGCHSVWTDIAGPPAGWSPVAAGL